MTEAAGVFFALHMLLFGLTLLLASIYSILILSVRRLHCRSNVFTGNMCVTITFCGLYWMAYNILLEYHSAPLYRGDICLAFIFAQMLFTVHVPFAFVIALLHRCCSAICRACRFWKTRACTSLCLMCQWLASLAVSLPMLTRNPVLFDRSHDDLVMCSLLCRCARRLSGNASMRACVSSSFRRWCWRRSTVASSSTFVRRIVACNLPAMNVWPPIA